MITKNRRRLKSNCMLILLLVIVLVSTCFTPLTASVASSVTYLTLEQAVAAVHEGFLQHKPNITVYVKSNIDLSQGLAIYDYIYEPAAKDCDGEAYHYSVTFNDDWPYCSGQICTLGNNKFQVKFLNIDYTTTFEQERKFNAKLSAAIEGMNLWQLSDYKKYRTIYEFICNNVVYDEDAYAFLRTNGHIQSQIPYTAYAALMNGKAVCAGYSRLFYAMCKYVGLPVEYVSGTANGRNGWGNHAWNFVKLNGEWYQVDVTWDAGDSPERWRYFLKGLGGDFSQSHILSNDTHLTEVADDDYIPTAADFEPVSPFRDTQSLACYDAAWELSNMGLISGTSRSTFSPSSPITRAQIATMIYRYTGECTAGGQIPRFKDVSSNDYYYDAAIDNAVRGIISGYPDQTFRGSQNINLEQMAVILKRFANSINANTYKETTGRQLEGVSDYAYESVDWALANGIVDSVDNPQASLTRGEVAIMLQRLLKAA